MLWRNRSKESQTELIIHFVVIAAAIATIAFSIYAYLTKSEPQTMIIHITNLVNSLSTS